MLRIRPLVLAVALAGLGAHPALSQRTVKPVLHGRHWVAITGKPLAATAGAMIFQRGGNAVDATCAMLGAVTTMWDVLSWGGETQALIYHPGLKKVIGINALGVAPTGATPAFYHSKGMNYPPEFGPLAAITPGTPGGLMTMLAEYGTMSLKVVLAPAAGEIFRQADLAVTLRKLVEAEQQALKQGKTRKEAIYAAYDRFYKGDIADELVRSVREQGGLFTREDLANWRVKIEEPVSTSYRGIEVYKLREWQQGPAMLQALNILENADLKSMGYNSARYVHTVYQAMSLAFADRDFYYGDPAFPPATPIKGLLSKDYARKRYGEINWDRNDPTIKPGDPYPFQGGTNPFLDLLKSWPPAAKPVINTTDHSGDGTRLGVMPFDSAFRAGTTSIQAADEQGWVVSVTPSGGWVPAVIAGRTGVGLSQRAQSFVLDRTENPFNVMEPGKRPRVTLTPTLALKDGRPFVSMAVQGGDTQDQNLLQFFLNMVEFGMNVQQATEAPNIVSYQMLSSFGAHDSRPGRLTLNDAMPTWVREELRRMGYAVDFARSTSGPINAIFFDWKHGSFWGGSSTDGEDYGIAW